MKTNLTIHAKMFFWIRNRSHIAAPLVVVVVVVVHGATLFKNA